MKNRRFVAVAITSVITVSVFFFSFKVLDQVNSDASVLQKTKILMEVISRVMDNYVDDVDMPDLIDKAINAIVKELDPHSNYLPPANYELMSEQFLGYQGIGVQFRMIDEKVTVMRVLRNGPSERAGLMLGDHIVAVEGESIVGLEQPEIPKILKGPAGTRVNVTIERPGIDKPLDITITRGRAIVNSVKYFYMIDDKTGYMKLETFSRTSEDDIEYAIERLEAQGMEKLVFDLRGNTGGLLDQAVKVADKFLSGGKKIVETKGRIPSANSSFSSTNSPSDVDLPLVVLIDQSSASASEVVSGAFQDMDRAIVVGKTSFGKGLMQLQYQMEDRSALVLTTGRWYTPLGRLIQKEYDEKTREEYRRDAFNDSLTTIREQNEDRPAFRTPKGRTVYGGGGVAPDFEIEYTDLVSTFAIRMVNSRDGDLPVFSNSPVFRFARDFSRKNKGRWKDVFDFMENYEFTGEDVEDYKTYLADKDSELLDERFDKAVPDIGKFVKARVAEFLWGDEGFIRVTQRNDNVLKESLKHFDEAEALIRK